MTDCENREIYTVNVDSIGFSTYNDFTTFFNIPLRNVVAAEILSVNIPWSVALTPSSNVVYIHIDQLVSKFNDRTLQGLAENLGGIGAPSSTAAIAVSNASVLQGSFVRISSEQTPGNTRTKYSSSGDFSSRVEFIDPIRQLDKLRIRLLDERGTPLNVTGPGFFTLRFECSKNNVCLY